MERSGIRENPGFRPDGLHSGYPLGWTPRWSLEAKRSGDIFCELPKDVDGTHFIL